MADTRYTDFIDRIKQSDGSLDVFRVAREVGFSETESKTVVPYILVQTASSIIEKSRIVEAVGNLNSDAIARDLGAEMIKIKEHLDSLSMDDPSYEDLGKLYLMAHDRYVKHTGMDKEEKTKRKAIDISVLTDEEQEQWLNLMNKLNV